MKTIDGDLIKLAKNGKFDVIVHGANCFNTMGAGVAKSIRREFPEAFKADCLTERGDKFKLGKISSASIDVNGRPLIVVNAYTQFGYMREGILVNYNAIRSCFKIIKQKFSGKRIGYPKIGAGLGGGDWEKISKIIDEELADEDHTLVSYTPRTRVVNLRGEPYDVYIGRAGKGQSGYFGNPFRLTEGESRGATIERFREYFYKRIKEDAEFKSKVESLRGKVLGCFCKPFSCHGDVYVEYLEQDRD